MYLLYPCSILTDSDDWAVETQLLREVEQVREPVLQTAGTVTVDRLQTSHFLPLLYRRAVCLSVFMYLQKSSIERQRHLDSLYDFVSRATQELIWLNEKEEEEVAFDWSERNSNISRKRDYHSVSSSHIVLPTQYHAEEFYRSSCPLTNACQCDALPPLGLITGLDFQYMLPIFDVFTILFKFL